MTSLKIAKIIAALSIIIGISVIIGWYFDITILTSVSSQWIRMKFATALCFIFSGIIIYFLSVKKNKLKETQQIVLTIFSMFLVLVMGTLFLGLIFGFQTGMENIAFVDVHELTTPAFKGMPSVVTMISFLLIALTGFLFNFNYSIKKAYVIIGIIVGTIGLMGIIGYSTNIPFLYYEIPGISNAIAIHTTILFFLLGLALVLIGSSQEN